MRQGQHRKRRVEGCCAAARFAEGANLQGPWYLLSRTSGVRNRCLEMRCGQTALVNAGVGQLRLQRSSGGTHVHAQAAVLVPVILRRQLL